MEKRKKRDEKKKSSPPSVALACDLIVIGGMPAGSARGGARVVGGAGAGGCARGLAGLGLARDGLAALEGLATQVVHADDCAQEGDYGKR